MPSTADTVSFGDVEDTKVVDPCSECPSNKEEREIEDNDDIYSVRGAIQILKSPLFGTFPCEASVSSESIGLYNHRQSIR